MLDPEPVNRDESDIAARFEKAFPMVPDRDLWVVMTGDDLGAVDRWFDDGGSTVDVPWRKVVIE